MTTYGYTLFSELNGPKSLVRQAVDAEEAGFDFLVMSDHFHPWQASHSDSPFAWSVLGAVAERTERVQLATLVTCPFLRYHPAIIAQAAATIGLMSDDRFTLALGAGERLNEHVVGLGWPAVDVRHEMLAESVEVIRELWQGDYVTYRGDHVTVEDAKVFSLPDSPPDIAIAISGQRSLDLAVEHADAVVAVDTLGDLVAEFKDRKGGRATGQIPVAWDPDPDEAEEAAMHFAFGIQGWKVMAELPNPVNFDAAISTVRREDVLEEVPHGPDPEPYIETVTRWADAGFDDICIVQVGDERGDAFFEFWNQEVRPKLP